MPSLALVMIARDEARCIARCLLSAAAHVDEMWVLDTGSVDDTPAIAQRCGATVARWEWRDDFAAARNAALALTRADWRLVIDADEWIGAGAATLDDWRRDAAPRIGLLRVASLVEGAGADGQVATSWLPRLLPRGVAYRGRVHEQPLSALPRQRLGLQLLHDGYLPGPMVPKRGRNRRLLQQALQADPGDAYLHYQLGKDHEVHGEFAAAEPCYAIAQQLGDAAAAWRHDLVLRTIYTRKKLGAFAAAMALAEAEMPRWQSSPDFFFTLGDLLLDWAATQPRHASRLLPMAEGCWQRALAIGENPGLPDTVRGRGSFLAAHNLAVLCEGLGDAAQAGIWRERSMCMRVEAEAADAVV
ncbi:MAG: glycosyltransferase [Rubrivivax sp.]|nr:glycosyltransferase [Pseudomonadota bacterium]MCW5637371.1 glycosyltransferase [Rubrivivax sp.]HOW46549.1 glycosyltransferase [Rubrivivax sp.]HRY86313.1 glycosyltransferase [Rubrivivax sp.]